MIVGRAGERQDVGSYRGRECGPNWVGDGPIVLQSFIRNTGITKSNDCPVTNWSGSHKMEHQGSDK